MRRTVLTAALAAALALGAAAGPAAAQGDAAAGERVYKKCRACHTVDKDGRNKIGPNLWGVVGREAGAVEGFRYSTAMLESGLVWTDDQLDAYLAAPRKFIRGNKMAFAGLRNEQDRADIIAFLKTLAD